MLFSRSASEPRHHGAAVGLRFHQTAGDELAQGLTNRCARYIEAARESLIERRAQDQRPAHNLVGELQPQLFRQRHLAGGRRRPINPPGFDGTGG